MKIYEAIYNKLSTTAAITALTGTKIYPLTIPEGDALPAVVFEIIGNAPETDKDGPANIDIWSCSIEIHSKSMEEVGDISDAIRTALDRYTGTHAGVGFDQINYKDTSDDHDEGTGTYIRTDLYSVRESKGAAPNSGVSITDANNPASPILVAAGGEYTCQSGTCADGTVNVNSALFGTVASGGTLNVPVRNSAATLVGTIVGGNVDVGDATAVIKNSAGTTLDTEAIPAAVSEDITLADVNHIDTDGTAVPTASGAVFTATAISALTCAQMNDNLTQAQRDVVNQAIPLRTGQTTSFATDDDGDLETGRMAAFLTLSCNNAFGNTNRFTNSLGGATYDGSGGELVNYVIDHATGLGWTRTVQTSSRTWAQAVADGGSSTLAGFANWRLPNANEWGSIIHYGAATTKLNYAPFSNASDLVFWTSSTLQGFTANAYFFRTGQAQNFHLDGTPKSGTYNTFFCRNHY